MKTYQHFIDGQYVDPAAGRWFDSMNPYLGEAWAKVPQGCAQDADRAVKAASRALREGPWATMTPSARGKLMLRLADLITANADRLAEIEVRDNGKLLSEMAGQMKYHPEWWRYFGGLADKVEGAVVPIDKPEAFALPRGQKLDRICDGLLRCAHKMNMLATRLGARLLVMVPPGILPNKELSWSEWGGTHAPR